MRRCMVDKKLLSKDSHASRRFMRKITKAKLQTPKKGLLSERRRQSAPLPNAKKSQPLFANWDFWAFETLAFADFRDRHDSRGFSV